MNGAICVAVTTDAVPAQVIEVEKDSLAGRRARLDFHPSGDEPVGVSKALFAATIQWLLTMRGQASDSEARRDIDIAVRHLQTAGMHATAGIVMRHHVGDSE